MTETGRATSQEIILESVVLEKTNGDSLVLYPPPQDDGGAKAEVFQGMNFTESIFEPTVRGSITIRDSFDAFEGFNPVGGELLKVKAYNPSVEGEAQSPDHIINCVFLVHDCRKISNEAAEQISGPVSGQVYWKLDFCTPEYYLYEQEDSYLESDFIGPISGENGLVQQLKEKYFSAGDGENQKMSDDNIEETSNSIWLKKNNLMYPWGKSRSQPSLFNLIDNLTENAVSANNPNAVNYLFYNTTKGYSFRSVNDMILKAEDEPRDYSVNVQKPDDDSSPEYVVSISDFDHLSLWKNGGYGSFYSLVKPSFTDYYFDHLDFNESHERNIVEYQYHKEFDNIEHIEEYRLLPEDVETTRQNSHEIHDSINGYFAEHYNNSNRHSNVTVLDYEDGYGNKLGKDDKKTWQTVFDISSLPVEDLKTIRQIKSDLRENKEEYARLRNLRNRFDTYECSVCCLQQSPGVTGSVSDYRIVSAGSFSDVVDFEREERDDEEGIRFRTSYITEDGATGPWNQTLGEFYYLKDEVPLFNKYVIDTEITRLQLALDANFEFLDACNSKRCDNPDDFNDPPGCPECDKVRAINCCVCREIEGGGDDQAAGNDSCSKTITETQDRINRIQRRLEEWYEFRDQFPNSYDRFINKRAYFISKQPEIDKLNTTTSQDSLFNVKSVKRIPLRNSRYEQFARKYNVRDNELGEWIYNAYLGNDPDNDPLEPGGHPVYDQKYMDFEVTGPGAYRDSSQRWWGITTSDRVNQYCDCDYNENSETTQCFECDSCFQPNAGFWGGVNVTLDEVDRFVWRVGTDYSEGACSNFDNDEPNIATPVFEETEHGPPWGIVAPPWHPRRGEILLPDGEFNPFEYSQRWNFYIDDIADFKPVSIKRKEVQSFVRVEFESPIGLETLEQFPEGFIRDAGYEYFLPYLVMLTPGPYGKQGARKNMAVIGIDPYGFDVAVEPDDPDYGENTDDEGMNLYPSEEWDTERPYYTTSGGRGYRYYYGRSWYSSASWNRKGHAYDTLYHSSINLNSGAPNSYYHFDYTPPLPAYHRYGGWYYGYYNYYQYYSNYEYYWNSWYNFGYVYGDGYWYDTYEYEEPSLEDTDSFGAGGRWWWSWRWYYGYNWLWGTEAEYRAGTPENEIWTYDTSGNTEYGMIEPPQGHAFYYQRSNDKHEMGRNFAAQFIVFSRRVVNSCSDGGYVCANPEGPVSSVGCPEDDPYCNCPEKYLIPRRERVLTRVEFLELFGREPQSFLDRLASLFTEEVNYVIIDEENNVLETLETIEEVDEWLDENGEIAEKPTDERLEEAKRLTRECELISENLDESWLGCMWSNLDDPISCNCPGRGPNFKKYVEYTRTNSTYWDTPEKTPLLRNAQMLQLNSQKALIVINGDFSLQPGQIIRLTVPIGVDGGQRQNTRASGKWLVSQIDHTVTTQQVHRMLVSLVRDTSSVPPDETSWADWFRNILGS